MYKVFFVDDEAAMRAGLRNSISWEGSDFVLAGEASDGEMALSLISEIMPDILITDVRMPFMDGIELSKRVARTMPWVKIIILSGHDEFEYAKAGIKIGVLEYLLKPVTSSILFEALETAGRAIRDERERQAAMDMLVREAEDAKRLAYGEISEVREVIPEEGADGQGATSGLRPSKYDDTIKRSIDYIASNYADFSISLASAAEVACMSPNHFSTIFRQETGETFIEYLTRIRIEHAKRLLRTTATKASEIASLVGYNDPHYFSYVFKKNTGTSPSVFRK